MTSCELNQIFLGEVASIQNYGAFVRIPGCKQQGLIHKSQVSSSRVDDVGEVLQRGDRVWCKVINIGEDGKIGLSMKHVNQGNGKDLDPNGVEQKLDEQRRKKFIPGQKKPIELEAVLNTTCAKCGTRGHLKKDCFMTADGQKYDLIPEIDEITEPEKKLSKDEKKVKSKKLKKRKKSKKSKQKTDESSDDEDENNYSTDRKKKKKKRPKESKKKKRKRSDSSSESDSSESLISRDNNKGKRESGDKKSKKCKHSRSKHSD